MILADKIVSLRKKAGWSQEDLAEKLGVTRQSVSKWEGAQSVPDMDKVVMMSRLFGVSTDFLLKDELEEETPCAAAQEDDTPLRRVSLTQASAYLALRKAAAPKIAIATALCITSPVTLILLAGMSEVQRFHITENAASGIGLCVLLGLVGAVLGQLGDLSFSCVKRQYGIKDYGRLLPGHGGVLDRFDSVIFAAPVIWMIVNAVALY